MMELFVKIFSSYTPLTVFKKASSKMFDWILNTPLIPAGFYVLNVNNKGTRTRCEICSKLIIKTPERHQWRRYDVFIVNFESISHLVLMFLLLTLNM